MRALDVVRNISDKLVPTYEILRSVEHVTAPDVFTFLVARKFEIVGALSSEAFFVAARKGRYKRMGVAVTTAAVNLICAYGFEGSAGMHKAIVGNIIGLGVGFGGSELLSIHPQLIRKENGGHRFGWVLEPWNETKNDPYDTTDMHGGDNYYIGLYQDLKDKGHIVITGELCGGDGAPMVYWNLFDRNLVDRHRIAAARIVGLPIEVNIVNFSSRR